MGQKQILRLLWSAAPLWAVLALTGCAPQDVPGDGLPGGGGSPSGADDNAGDAAGGGDATDPWAAYVPDPDVYVARSDAARLLETTAADGTVARFPSNQMLVLLNEGVPRTTAERLAAEVAGTIVGQSPDDGFYQIELGSTTLAELDAAIAHWRADPEVTAAGRAIFGRLAQVCPADDDNGQLADDDRCAFTATEYYQAITMFEFFRPHLTLHRVIVGIIDTGVDVSSGEFTVARIRNLNEIDATPTDFDPGGHGTAIAGIIGAEDTGRGINGLAWRFLRDNLYMAVSTMGEDPNIQPQVCIASAVVLTNAGASIINCSFGWPASDPEFDVIRQTWRRIISRRPNVLFVAAAGNENTELTGSNYAPGGMNLPNLITVAGTALCNPQELYANSNHGRVDIAAPAVSVPATSRDGSFRLLDGTSIATPQVTALAAVLESLRPSLTAAEIKRYITAYALSGGVAGTFGRLTFTSPIGQLLIDMDVPDPVRSWIDPQGLGNFGASGLVLARLCPAGISYRVDGYGSWDIFEPDHDTGLGLLGSGDAPPTVRLSGGLPDEVSLVMAGDNVGHFTLGTYVIGGEGGDVMQISFMDFASNDLGSGAAGTVTFDSCSIEQRDPFDGIDPWIVRLNGEFAGVLEMAHWDGRDPTFHEITGHFTLPAMTTFAGPDDPLREYLETTCEGGLPSAE